MSRYGQQQETHKTRQEASADALDEVGHCYLNLPIVDAKKVVDGITFQQFTTDIVDEHIRRRKRTHDAGKRGHEKTHWTKVKHLKSTRSGRTILTYFLKKS